MESKDIFHVALVTVVILLIPLIAMQWSDQINWRFGDYLIAGILIFGVGISLTYLAKSKLNSIIKKVLGIVLLLLFILMWTELAVGLFGTPWAGS